MWICSWGTFLPLIGHRLLRVAINQAVWDYVSAAPTGRRARSLGIDEWHRNRTRSHERLGPIERPFFPARSGEDIHGYRCPSNPRDVASPRRSVFSRGSGMATFRDASLCPPLLAANADPGRFAAALFRSTGRERRSRHLVRTDQLPFRPYGRRFRNADCGIQSAR